MPRRRVLVLVLSGFAPACVDARVQSFSAPDEVAWIAAVGLGSAPRVSSLVRREEGKGLPIAQEAAGLVLLGYDEESVRALSEGVTREEIESEPLELAAACTASLPRPVWTQTIPSGAAATIPTLTSSWIQRGRRCEPGTLAVRVSCAGDGVVCPLSLRAGEDPCETTFEACDLLNGPFLTIERARPDLACIRATDCEQTETESALGSATCGSAKARGDCLLEVVEAPAPELDLLRVSLSDGPLFLPREFDGTGELETDWLRQGSLRDVMVLDDKLLVLRMSGSRLDRLGRCPAAEPAIVEVLDARTGQQLSSLGVTPCADHLAASELVPSFFATASSTVTAVIERYSLSGTLERSARLDLASLVGAEGRAIALTVLLPLPSLPLVVLVLRELRENPEEMQFTRSHLVVLSDELEVLFVQPFESLEDTVRFDTAIAEAENTLIVYDNGFLRDRIRWFELALEERQFRDLDAVALELTTGHLDVGPVALHRPSGRVVVGELAGGRGIYTVTRGKKEGRDLFFERAAPVTALHEWPGSHGGMLVLGLDGTESYATFLDPETGRVVPGSVRVGEGVVSEIVRFEDALWMLLPWSGELVRVREP